MNCIKHILPHIILIHTLVYLWILNVHFVTTLHAKIKDIDDFEIQID